MVIIGISEQMNFQGRDEKQICGYRLDFEEPNTHPDALGMRSDHCFIPLQNMKSEYYSYFKEHSEVIPIRGRSGKVQSFLLAKEV